MTSEYLRDEVPQSIELAEAALRLDAPREALDCLAVEVHFAAATLLFPAADRARLRSLLRQLRSWRDGRRNLPPLRASKLAAAIVSLDADAVTWNRKNGHWTRAMKQALDSAEPGALAEESPPVRVQVRGADPVEAERRIAWILGQQGVPE